MVLEGFASIDKHDRNFVVILTPQFGIAVDVNFAPGKAAASRELRKALLYNFAQMAALARIDDDAWTFWHGEGILTRLDRVVPALGAR